MRVFFLLLGLLTLDLAKAEDIRVLAAASLTDAMGEIAPAYEKQTGDKVIFSFAGSNVLARQIREGAPADAFVSADDAQMNALQKDGLIVASSRREILSNTLVIVVGKESVLKLDSPQNLTQPAVKRLALADPKAVPAGVYAREYLAKIGLWDALKSRVVPTENVRAALAAVESGNVEAGIVYKTDAGISKAVKIAEEISSAEGPHISYPGAVVRNSGHPAAAEKFLTFLRSEAAGKIFRKFGFIVPE